MDFTDERYVRLYVRNTGTWIAWAWQARALLPLLLRVLDRSGRVEWPARISPDRAIAGLVLLPEDVVAVGLRELAEYGTIRLGVETVETVHWIEMPNFVLGQYVRSENTTPAERTKAWKAKVGYPSTRAERRVETRGDGGDGGESTAKHQPVETVETVETLRSGGDAVQCSALLSVPSKLTTPTPPPAEGSPSSTRRLPRKAASPELEGHVLAELQAACRTLTGKPNAGPRRVTPGMRDALAKLHAAEEPTAEEWSQVIAHRLALSQQGDRYGDLSWEHLCRAQSFRRYRDAEAPAAGRPAIVDHDDVPDWLTDPTPPRGTA